MTNWNKIPTGRIDTTVTEVAVRRGDDRAADTTAVAFVRAKFPEAVILSVSLTGERDSGGNPVYGVEWEAKA